MDLIIEDAESGEYKMANSIIGIGSISGRRAKRKAKRKARKAKRKERRTARKEKRKAKGGIVSRCSTPNGVIGGVKVEMRADIVGCGGGGDIAHGVGLVVGVIPQVVVILPGDGVVDVDGGGDHEMNQGVISLAGGGVDGL